MKQNLQGILTATTASFLTFTVLAQDDKTAASDRAVQAGDRVNHPHARRLHSAAKASDIIGMRVNNYQNEKLGTVEDLGVDLESGRIVQVILSTGGYLGINERLSAVPPGALHHDVANKVLHLDANKQKLKSAPEFKTANWVEYSDADHLSAVYTYYGQDSAFRFIHQGDPADVTPTRNADGTLNRNRVTGDKQWMIPASRLGHVQKASKLMGLTLKNQQDEKLGKVDNMLVDIQSGRIVAVVVSSDGFLGLGDELSAIPPTALAFNTERDTLQLDMSKDRLAAAPHFKSDQWPDFNQPAYSDNVYRAYNVSPYFTTNTVADADNTARNVRDRDDSNLTPFDQGNSKADTDTTGQIRKGILAGKDMSVNARNVKIITNNGRVTLRGPVKTAEEKRIIGEIANRIASSENVDNQLEVALKADNE